MDIYLCDCNLADCSCRISDGTKTHSQEAAVTNHELKRCLQETHRDRTFCSRRLFSNALACVLIFIPQVFASTSVRSDDATLRADAIRLFGNIEPISQARLAEPRVQLGQELFWDVRVSGDGKTSCASCHLAKDRGADRRRFSLDAKGKNTARNSQTVFNAVLQPSLR